MKKMSRILSTLLVICMIVAMLPSVFAEENKADFAFLVTSDLHGQVFATDYSADQSKSGTYRQGLTRVSSYIKEMRAEYGEDLYVADIGDSIQGTPLTYYYAFQKPEVEDPTVKAFRSIGYDMWVVGNHEFNYGMNILKRQLDYATSESTATEKQLAVSMANYLKAETNSDEKKDWATWNDYAPYVIKEMGGIKVAIMGIGNPNIANWDIPANWEGIYFANPVETYQHYEKEMTEKADMIVVMSHSGVEGNSQSDSDFMTRLVSSTNTIDFVFSGHNHGKQVLKVKNADGKEIPILQPSTKAAVVAQVLVSYDKTTGEATLNTELKDMRNYKLDEDLVKVLQPYEDAAWNDYMNEVIGTASDDFTASNLGGAPSAFLDFVNKVQLWGAYDNNGKNTPDDKSDDTPAQLSISAPLTSGNSANLIAKGDIHLGDLFKLYRYENWFYQLTMSGEEIHQWLEYSASKVRVGEDGNVSISGGLTYYDVIYGEGFSYVIDPTKPVGERVVSMTYDGVEIAPNATFTVVMNNYRFNGGGGYVDWINEHGCNFTSSDESRVIYSTQFDMIQGEDLGQARSLITEYIKANKTINPTIESTWSIDTDGYTNDDINIFYTNDVHTYIDGALSYDNIAELKDTYEAKNLPVLLVDAGDHSQGTAYGSMDKGENIMKLMKSAGYDLATLGNHEFDYGMERTLQFVDEKTYGIPYVSANFYHEEKGVKGENVLDAYKIFEIGGKKIAIVGITTPESFTKSTPAYFQNEKGEYIYGIAGGKDGKELYASVQAAIDEAAKEKPDYIIALGHLGDDPSSKPWTSEELIANTTGLDAFIDGHSHSSVPMREVKNKDGKTVVLTQTGSYFNAIGQMTIAADGTISSRLVKEYTGSDEATRKIQDDWMADVDEKLGKVIGHADVTLDNYDANGNRLVRKSETNTGDFAADALYYLFSETNKLDVDIAVMNGGGVRNKAITGDLSYKSCKDIHTFGNVACLIEVTGQQILDALEWGAKDANPEGTKECGGFLQVAGATYEIHTYIPSTVQKDEKGVWTGAPTGEYRVKNVKIGGEPLDLKKTYRLAGYNYTLRDLGDGFAMFNGATNVLDYVMEDYMVLANYIQSFPVDATTKLPTIGKDSKYANVTGEGRIKLVNQGTNPFTDVKEGEWYYSYVLEMAAKGIVNGMTTTTYVPEGKLTRAQMAMMLYRVAGEPEVKEASTFTDVEKDAWYADAIAWAQDEGVVKGMTETTFEPESTITREQMVTMFYRMENTPETKGDLTKFEDEKTVSEYAVEAFQWAVEQEIINGTKFDSSEKVYLDPQGVTTRAQAAKVFSVWMGLE